MWDRVRDYWLPRLLFLLTLAVACGLALLVLAAPWLRRAGILPAGVHPDLLALFADDPIVRRTTLASAAGLAVTAFVFFRPGGLPFLKRKQKSVPPPIAGA